MIDVVSFFLSFEARREKGLSNLYGEITCVNYTVCSFLRAK